MKMQEIIQQLPLAIGAEIIEAKSGNLLIEPKYRARLKFKNWPMVIAFGTTTSGTKVSASNSYTYISTAFTSSDNFEFWITYKKNFGMFAKSSPVGYPELEGRNVNAMVNVEDRMKFVTLIQNSKVHELIVKIFDHDQGGFFSISPEKIYISKVDKNTHVLLFEKIGFIGSAWDEKIDLFKNVSELFQEILTQMAEMGSASEEEPDVRKLEKQQYWYKQK